MTGGTDNLEDFLSGKVLNEATRQSPAVRQGFEMYDQSVPDMEGKIRVHFNSLLNIGMFILKIV